MFYSKTNYLVAGMVCLSLAQACAPEGPFAGNWAGRNTTVSGGKCGEFGLAVLITGNKVSAVLDIHESRRTVSLNGRIDNEGRIDFSGRVGERDIYWFEGRFRDEQGLIQTDPGETGTGGALKGVWRKLMLEDQIGGAADLCVGTWSVTRQ